MASESTVQEKLQLIELVQFYPVLYDPSRDDYKSKNYKEEAWKQVTFIKDSYCPCFYRDNAGGNL